MIILRILNLGIRSDAKLAANSFGDNPQVVRFFAKLASVISEGSFVKPGGGEPEPGQKRDEAGRPMLSFPSMEK